MSYNLNWNLDGYWLIFRNEEEVYVKSLVGNRMILYLVEYCITVSSIAELKVDDVRVRSVSDSLEILCIDSEKNVLHSENVDVARNLSCSTNCLYLCLVAGLTDLAIKFNVLHCCLNLKCVTQFDI